MGEWRGPRTPRDPLLTTRAWRQIRQHWIRLRLPCARCGRPIDYDGPRFYVTATGKRRQNPRYLVVGHKVDRYRAKLMGWTAQQINALENTQPECVHCSNRSGAQLGQRVQAARQAQPVDTARRW